MKRGTNGVAAGIVAAIVFLALFIVLEIGVVPSLALSLASFVAGLFLFKTKGKEDPAARADLKDALSEGRQKLQSMRDLGRSIRDPATKEQVGELCALVEKILATVSDDPKKLSPARQFLGFYLDSTLKIIGTYAELEAKDIHDAEIQASLEKARSMLRTIHDAFEKQLAKLVSGDVLDLDAELSLMQQTIEMEGLGKGLGGDKRPT